MTTAIAVSSVLASIGINTHIDFNAYGYENLSVVEAAINYLGVKNIRDSASNGGDLQAWTQVAQATGAKFDDYIGETSPSGMQAELSLVPQLAQAGILNYVEGGNEEDDAYPASLGNNLQITAQFQQQVYAMGQQYGLGVINMSFGAGWTAANDWHGNYDKVGDLSGSANYGNAHTYPNNGTGTDTTIQQLNADAQLAAGSRPVITTEIGWNTGGGGAAVQGVVQGVLDGIKDGDAAMYFYALFNDSSGAYGLMNGDGSPTAAGAALHNLTTLLADSGSNGSPGSLDFSLSGQQSGDNTLLMQKSDGSYWLALWDEGSGDHNVTVNLANPASQIQVFDPVTGTSSIATASNSNSISVNLSGDPLLIEVVPSGGTSTTSSSGASASSGTAGNGDSSSGITTTSSGSGDTVPTSSASGSSSGSSGSTAENGSASGPNPVLTVPASASATAGSTIAISGVSFSDPWAVSNPGVLALNVVSTGGTVSMTDSNGNPVSGSGTNTIRVQGTVAQINAELGSLSYTAGGNSGSISINVWDQLGAQATQSIQVNSGSGDSGSNTTGGSTGTTSTGSNDPSSGSGTSTASNPPAIAIASDNNVAIENVSNTTIGATSGDHMVFLGGTGDTLTATGGTETVKAFQGGNTITTGANNDTLYYSGTNNVVDAGGGNNTLLDSGNNNTIVLPGANQGYDDVFGYLMSNGDQFDLRSLLAGTSWNGDVGTIGNYVSLTTVNNSAVVNVNPSGDASGGSYAVATLESTGPLSLNTFLAHSIT